MKMLLRKAHSGKKIQQRKQDLPHLKSITPEISWETGSFKAIPQHGHNLKWVIQVFMSTDLPFWDDSCVNITQGKKRLPVSVQDYSKHCIDRATVFVIKSVPKTTFLVISLTQHWFHKILIFIWQWCYISLFLTWLWATALQILQIGFGFQAPVTLWIFCKLLTAFIFLQPACLKVTVYVHKSPCWSMWTYVFCRSVNVVLDTHHLISVPDFLCQTSCLRNFSRYLQQAGSVDKVFC